MALLKASLLTRQPLFGTGDAVPDAGGKPREMLKEGKPGRERHLRR
jgi:hypothetical protein